MNALGGLFGAVHHAVALIDPLKERAVQIFDVGVACRQEFFADALAAVAHGAVNHNRSIFWQISHATQLKFFVAHPTCLWQVTNGEFGFGAGVE